MASVASISRLPRPVGPRNPLRVQKVPAVRVFNDQMNVSAHA
jgi:hypothetical protein